MTPERLEQIAAAGGLELDASMSDGVIRVDGADPALPSRFAIGEVAAAALAEIGDAAGDLAHQAGRPRGPISTSVAEGAQQTISFGLMRVNGVPVARTNQSNPYVRSHRCRDGRWIFLHGGFPALQQGLADLLELPFDATFGDVARACASWDAEALEQEVAARSLCGGMFRTIEEWQHHPHGSTIWQSETVRVRTLAVPLRWTPTDPTRVLSGLRVLDLTRVLAGPTCGRTLAALGADVLQVTGPDTPNVPAFVHDTGHGKRRATCDLRVSAQRARLREVAVEADVIVQGYRPGVVERHGLASAALRDLGFRGLYANISCFGPEGPFADRAGWEQVAQAVSGIGLTEGSIDSPAMLPAAATDYTTGLRMAGALIRRLGRGQASDLDGSLCQTAAWLIRSGYDLDPDRASGIGTPTMETVTSPSGSISRLGLGVRVQGLDVNWRWSSATLGSSVLGW